MNDCLGLGLYRNFFWFWFHDCGTGNLRDGTIGFGLIILLLLFAIKSILRIHARVTITLVIGSRKLFLRS